MALSIKDWSVTPASNTSVDGVAIGENCPFANMNNMGRAIMAATKLEVASIGSNVAAAATPDISGDGGVHTVTGVTTITGFATAPAGLLRVLHFETATPLTNGAALALPGSTSLTTSKGAVGAFRSLGSGNWKCEYFTPAAGNLAANLSSLTVTDTDAGAAENPYFIADRNSASPAVSDILGGLIMRGRDSGGNATDYGKVRVLVLDPTDGSEDSQVQTIVQVGGALTVITRVGPGVQIGVPTGTDKGLGTLNAAAGLYINGHGTVAQVVSSTDAVFDTTATALPYDNTIPQNTEGEECLSVAITPTNASSNLYITVSGLVGCSTTAKAGLALFVDSTANALNASWALVDATSTAPINFTHVVAAGSTSARTYKVNYGSSTGTGNWLGTGGAGIGGGVVTGTITVVEVLPQ